MRKHISNNMKILIFIISSNILFSTNCENLSKYPCISTSGCKWDAYSQSCIVYQSQYETILDNAYDYVQNKADQIFVDFLVYNGFKKLEIDGEVLFTNEGISLSYKDLIIHGLGVEFKDLKFQIQERGEFVMLKFDSISVNMSIAQLVYIMEDIANGSLNKVDSFDFNLSGAYLYVSAEDIETCEVTLDSFSLIYDGYLNERIFENIDRYGIFPSYNQIFKINLSGLKLNQLITDRGEDLINDPLALTGISSVKDLYVIKSANFNLEYLPSYNSFKLDYSLDHPIFNFSNTFNSRMVFQSDFRLANSSWTSNNAFGSLNFTSPTAENFNMDFLRGRRGGEVLITKLPNKISMSSSCKYNEDLVKLFNFLDGPMPQRQDNVNTSLFSSWLDPYAYFDYTAVARDFSFDVVNINKEEGGYYRPDYYNYNTIDFRNFKTTMKLQNNSIIFNSNVSSNLANGNIDFVFDLANAKINRFDVRLTNVSSLMEKYINIIENENDIEFIKANNDIHLKISGELNNRGRWDNFKIDGLNFTEEYLARGYAADARSIIWSIYEASKFYVSENGEWPTDITQINDGNYLNIPYSTLNMWNFEIDLKNYDKWPWVEGYITGTSLEPMPGGAGHQIAFDVVKRRFYGYGQQYNLEEAE